MPGSHRSSLLNSMEWVSELLTRTANMMGLGSNRIDEKKILLITTEAETWKFYLNRRAHPNGHKCQRES